MKVIDLINNQQAPKKTHFFFIHTIDKMRIKKYSTKMMLKQFVISWNKIVSLLLTLFVGAFIIMSALITVPSNVKSVMNNYYKAANYNLENSYTDIVVNNPMTYYTTYSDESSDDTFFPDYYSPMSNNENDAIPMQHVYDSGNADGDFALDAFIVNFLMVKKQTLYHQCFTKNDKWIWWKAWVIFKRPTWPDDEINRTIFFLG